MPHYYFDLKDGATKRDHAGLAFESDDHAIARARLLANSMGGHRRPPGTAPNVVAGPCQRQICLVREDGHEVIRLPVEN